MEYSEELVNYAIDTITERGEGVYGCDLHNELFNTDYYIVGYYQAEEWLKENVGIFNAISEIREYENDNFGEVITDVGDSEKVVNMYVYIQGENILNESETLRDKWDVYLTEEDCKAICEELKDLL